MLRCNQVLVYSRTQHNTHIMDAYLKRPVALPVLYWYGRPLGDPSAYLLPTT